MKIALVGSRWFVLAGAQMLVNFAVFYLAQTFALRQEDTGGPNIALLGATVLGNVLTVTTHLTKREDLAAYNEEYANFFPTNKPARTTVEAVARPCSRSVTSMGPRVPCVMPWPESPVIMYTLSLSSGLWPA